MHFGEAGTPTLAADRYGDANKALHFNKGGNVEIPYNASLNPTTMSISLWAKADVNSPIVNNQYMVAMNRWNGYKLNFQGFRRPSLPMKLLYLALLTLPITIVTTHLHLLRKVNGGISS